MEGKADPDNQRPEKWSSNYFFLTNSMRLCETAMCHCLPVPLFRTWYEIFRTITFQVSGVTSMDTYVEEVLFWYLHLCGILSNPESYKIADLIYTAAEAWNHKSCLNTTTIPPL